MVMHFETAIIFSYCFTIACRLFHTYLDYLPNNELAPIASIAWGSLVPYLTHAINSLILALFQETSRTPVSYARRNLLWHAI